jgi:hypothetical protein
MPRQARDEGKGRESLKLANVTQWVRRRVPINPTRPKASHQAGSQTKVRSPRGGVRSRGEARTQAAEWNPEKGIVVDKRISPGDRTPSRLLQRWEGRSPVRGRASGRGHHRGLRSGHAFRGVTRELGRTSRLLGKARRSAGDRRHQHPGVRRSTRTANEPNLARAGRNTKQSASNQDTGREPQANQPGRTNVVVATRSTAGLGAARFWERMRGELRPKGPTIKAERQREGEAGRGERQARLRAPHLFQRNSHGLRVRAATCHALGRATASGHRSQGRC